MQLIIKMDSEMSRHVMLGRVTCQTASMYIIVMPERSAPSHSLFFPLAR